MPRESLYGCGRIFVLMLALAPLVGCGGVGGSVPAADPNAPVAPVSEATVNEAKKVLADPNSNALARSFSVRNLGEMGGMAKSALPELEKVAAGDADEQIRKLATDAIARIKSDAPPGAMP